MKILFVQVRSLKKRKFFISLNGSLFVFYLNDTIVDKNSILFQTNKEMLQCQFLSTGWGVSGTRLESHSSWFELIYINEKTDGSYTFQTCFFGTVDFLPLSQILTLREDTCKKQARPRFSPKILEYAHLFHL